MKKKKELKVRIRALNEPSEQARKNFTDLVVKMYLEGKLVLPKS